MISVSVPVASPNHFGRGSQHLPRHAPGTAPRGWNKRWKAAAMSKDLMKYDKLAQDALRGVVRLALERVRDGGLPGTHHFFITFRTNDPGVDISPALRDRYPVEMTIVLQHQFWDLEVTPETFSVTLSFNKISEPLTVPFTAVKTFFDPSVQFGLNFETASEGDLEPAEEIAFPERTTTEREAPEDASDKPAAPEGPADVVSLDSFRSNRKK